VDGFWALSVPGAVFCVSGRWGGVCVWRPLHAPRCGVLGGSEGFVFGSLCLRGAFVNSDRARSCIVSAHCPRGSSFPRDWFLRSSPAR